MNRPIIYFVDINDPDETGTYESNYCHTVLAADYDALAAELATERLRADAAVGDANAAECRVAELEELMASQAKAIREEREAYAMSMKAQQPSAMHILFDGPPGPESGRFVEVEDSTGKSINAGQWRQRDDGLWELVIVRAAFSQAAVVVMPERMTTIPEGKTISYAAGYDDALDVVARLNRNTVSLELLERMINFVDRNTHYQFGEPLTSFDAEGGRLENELRAILGAKP